MNSGAPSFTSVPSVKSIFSTNASTRARTSTFCGESSWPMISVSIAALVATTSVTCTAGGAGGATTSFLHETQATATARATTAARDERRLINHERGVKEFVYFITGVICGAERSRLG